MVCSNAGLEECREIPTILKEAVRVLKPHGRLVLHCLNREKSIWISLFLKYGFSTEEAMDWLRKVRLFAEVEQIEALALDMNLRVIDKKSDVKLGHILVFEK